MDNSKQNYGWSETKWVVFSALGHQVGGFYQRISGCQILMIQSLLNLNHLIQQIINQMDKKQVPIIGTTIYIGEVDIELTFGKFHAITFQDIIHKGYIIALVYGSLQADELYTRMHSSCVTSETLRSMDCDCVQQMEGSLLKISEAGNGIFFYLIQEGRGCGYIGKSRGCMISQYYEQTSTPMNTFDAYKSLGMISDYRDYRNVRDICKILKIDKTNFVLLTNNPDKIGGFKELGLNLSKIASIEITPGPFNIAYLKSKQQYGHLIYETKKKESFYKIPYPKIVPFTPHAVPDVERFIYVSSYYLPIKPIDNELYFNETEFLNLMTVFTPEEKESLTIQQSGPRFFIKFPSQDLIKKYSDLAVRPYWFKVNVFYDIGTSQDYIVLTHEFEIGEKESVIPIVRVQSESLFDRFPLKSKQYGERYKEIIKTIVRRGKGLIAHLYNDGRGLGLGHKILDETGVVHGIKSEGRDFDAASKLLKHFLGDTRFDLYSGVASFGQLKLSVVQHKLNISEFILFKKGEAKTQKHTSQDIGLDSLRERVREIPNYIQKVTKQFSETVWPEILQNQKVIVTGIGTSEIHAKFLCYLVPRFIFKTPESITRSQKGELADSSFIIFSQALSPNVDIMISKIDPSKVTWITTVDENSKRQDRLERRRKWASQGSKFITYEPEFPDNTLVRVSGPIAGFLASFYLSSHLKHTKMTFTPRILRPTEALINEFIIRKQIMFVVDSDLLPLLGNLAMKFLEGCFARPPIFCDQLNFSHGFYQYALDQAIPIVTVGKVNKELTKLVDSYCFSQKVDTLGAMSVLQLEIYCNFLLMPYIEHYQVNQLNWKGKESQKALYQLTTLSI